MSSLNDLFEKVQMIEEGVGKKPTAISRVAPVFKNVNKDMTAAGMSASSRDAMLYVTRVLSRTGIITPEVHDITIKGQHKDRMEKIMTILRAKEDEINAKSDEIADFMNKDLDNFTSGAGTDRGRTEKYKEKAKMISQEIQNIKAGKEADDALRDITVSVAQGLDNENLDDDIAALDFDEADIFIDGVDAGVKSAVSQKVADYLTGNGLKAEVTRAGVNVEAPTGFFGDNAMHAKFEDQFKGLVMKTDSNIGEDKIRVKFTGAEGPVEIEDAEHEDCESCGCSDEEAPSEDYEMVEDGEHEKDGSDGKFDDGDGVAETCDYKPCEDGEGELKHEVLAAIKDGAGEFAHKNAGLATSAQELAAQYEEAGDDERASIANNLAQYYITQSKFDEDEEVVAESKYTTGDSLMDIYANVKPIVETIVESTTVNENGQTSHTQQYIVEKAEAAIEQVYTNQYLTEQKASDSLLVPKEEKGESFKERYQPKTSYQLEELRRYGL